MMSGQQYRKPHAIMISLPYQGHINPFVSLALKLASRGIAITFVHLHYVHHRLSKACGTNGQEPDFFSQARQAGLDIRYTTIDDGFPLEFDRELHVLEHLTSMIHDFPRLVDKFVGKLIESLDPSSFDHFLVTDTAYTWQAAIARKYNIVHVSYWIENALVLALGYHWDIMRENGHVPCNDDRQVEIDYLPGIQSINTRDLMSVFSAKEALMVDIHIAIFLHAKNADFMLINTVEELESEALSVLSKFHPTYAIGPINFSDGLPTNIVSKSLWSESDCSQWLSSKSPGSVLYVSFGSAARIPKQEVEEIAYGLLLSGVNFIWVVRADMVGGGDRNGLPDGYEEKIKEKGLIVRWCDQIRVLSDPAVGGFLTHCGWNSTMESTWYGVPMMCRPVDYDQPTNRKVVVDDWRIGVNICDGAVVEREGVAANIKRLMNSEQIRGEASRLKETVQKALKVDGSSEKNFDQFLKDLMAKIHHYKNNNQIQI